MRGVTLAHVVSDVGSIKDSCCLREQQDKGRSPRGGRALNGLLPRAGRVGPQACPCCTAAGGGGPCPPSSLWPSRRAGRAGHREGEEEGACEQGTGLRR